jgi:hypothetical protein
MAPVPAALVPTKLPSTWLPVAPALPIRIPCWALPETRLQAPEQGPAGVTPVMPPTMLAAPVTRMPVPLASGAVPVAFTPT